METGAAGDPSDEHLDGPVLASRSRLRGLLRANRSIVADLDLDAVLTRIVEAARDLVEADYGALGVIRVDRQGLERFVHVGLDADTVRAIGPLPAGRGLLGLLVHHPEPIRVADLRDHPSAVGFPAHHPPMAAFLGVPIRTRDEVFGNLYLTRREGRGFDEDDEELVSALAATAGIAIENARLYAEATRRQEWLATSTALTTQLLAEPGAPLEAIARSVYELAGAHLVAVVQPIGDQLVVRVAVGQEAGTVVEASYPLRHTVSEAVLRTGEPVRIDDTVDGRDPQGRTVFLAERASIGPVMVLPLLGRGGVRGVLWVARGRGERPFTASDEDMATTFASQASIAWELADARESERRVDLLEDRARIARDLHDHVIQRLFAAGLTLQAHASRAGDSGPAIEDVVDDLDDVIKQIRNAIFQLRPVPGGVRAAVLDVVGELRSSLGFEPRVVFDGPVDHAVTGSLLNDVTAVVREALTNVAKHAGARSAEVSLDVRDGELRVLVTDDGQGIGSPTRSSGLGNLRVRAESRGGALDVRPQPSRGTRVEWRVPVS